MTPDDSKLSTIYQDLKPDCHEFCEGCNILGVSKADHGIVDYTDVEPVDVLFLTDSFVTRGGSYYPQRSDQERLLSGFLKQLEGSFTSAFSPSIKCPSTKDKDMKPGDKAACRQHLEATVRAYDPKLIIMCGNTPMVMLLKISGITKKRGNVYEYVLEDKVYPAMPIFHPFSVIKEPKNKFLFEQDVTNGIDRYIFGKTVDIGFEYNYIDTFDLVQSLWTRLKDTKDTVACDIETEGLDFRNHKMLTISFSVDDHNWVIPLYHKDSPFTHKEVDRVLAMCVKPILENYNNFKVMQNGKFDIKFLLKYNINPRNVWDTKLMFHLFDENMPKSLMDIVKYFFPKELESF